jgi:hypothetical protein
VKITSDQVVRFFYSQLQGIVKKVGEDRNVWKSIVKSGLPLNTDLMIEERFDEITEFVQAHFEDDINTKIALLKALEKSLTDLPVLVDDGESFDSVDNDSIREHWLNGSGAIRNL